ncbi:outer membrane biogenesis protein BamB [Rosistilla oblonga]|uniref:Outer membrane biogenesis protein BamB n=2 Tax=Rosistilla oblonga TaxID=2527990 RepID=A0A518IW64_9BACT|nr:outer membrane biogenesis protein BamB [Rosistilla oblonga]
MMIVAFLEFASYQNRKTIPMRSASIARFLGCAGLILCGSFATAENWPQFRGPHFNGSSTETNLPTEFSRTENVRWSADLPGPSAATPAIWGDHIFVSSTSPGNDELLALCFDRKTGKQLWKHEIAKGTRQDTRSTFAAPSPVTDGKVAIFFFGNGELVAYDFDGKQQWKRNLQNEYGSFAFQWTFSTSPLIYQNRLIMQVLQRDTPVNGRGLADKVNESYLMAIDPQTGENLWRIIRPSKAQAESREAFTTPIPYQHDGREELLVIGGDAITGHDPATGKELWRWGTWNPQRIGHWRHVPSPVVGDETILICAPKKDPIYAVAAGGKGLLDDSSIRWISTDDRNLTSDVPTPAFYDGDFFVLSDLRKMLMRVEPKTGKVKWEVKTPGLKKYEASPTVADGKIYVVNFAGDVVIFDAETGEIINNVSMDDPSENNVRSSVVVSGGNLFIRVNHKLYCIGK